MTTRDDLDRSISAWLTDVAPTREPEHLLDTVLTRTARTRRRSAWRIPERWIPMSTISTRATTTGGISRRLVTTLAVLAMILAVVGAIVFVGSQRRALPPPFGLAGNGLVAFGLGGDILVHDTIAGTSRTLIAGSTIDVGPGYSNDGTNIAYLRLLEGVTGPEPAELWVAGADGSNAHLLAGPLYKVLTYDWAPGGDSIAVSSLVDGKPSLTIIATNGSGTRTLDVGVSVGAVMWRAPGGAQILFRGIDGSGAAGLYLVRPDGLKLTRIPLDGGASVDGSYFDDPSLSPDGTRLAFHSPQPDIASSEGRGLQVHLVDLGPDGEVIRDVPIDHASGDADYEPMFLPDGERLVFWRNRADVFSLYLADADGEHPNAVSLDCCLAPDGSTSHVGRIPSPDGTSLLVYTGPDDLVQSIDLANRERIDAAFRIDDYAVWQRTAR